MDYYGPLKKHISGTRFVSLYHLSSKVARYKRVRVARALNKVQMNKGTYYREMVEMLAQQANDSESDTSNEKKTGQAEVCVARFIDNQPFKCLGLKKLKKKEGFNKSTK